MFKSECIFIWKIENFSFCAEGPGSDIMSPSFNVKEFEETSFHISLYPRCRNIKNYDFVSCFLDQKGSDKFPEFGCELKLIGSSGKILGSIESENLSKETGTYTWGCCEFVRRYKIVEDIEGCKEDNLTVYCRLLGKNNIKNVSEEHVCHTEILINRLFFTSQEIKYKSWMEYFNKENIYEFRNMRFEIALSEHATNGICRVIVLLRCKAYEPCLIDFALGLMDPYGVQVSSVERFKHYFNHRRSLNNSDSTKTFVSAILGAKLKLADGRDRITCRFSYSTGEKVTTLSKSTELSSFSHINETKKNLSSMQRDLQFLFQNKKFSDVKLRVDGQVIEAHKAVLFSRSPVFSRMFDHDTSEAKTGVVDIADIDILTLKLFLQFLYTDTIDEMDYEAAKNLLITADKYQVVSLKEKCSMVLKTKLSIENVFEIVSLADLIHQTDLKLYCIEFVIRNSSIILPSSEWIPWMKNNMELATHILSKITQNHFF